MCKINMIVHITVELMGIPMNGPKLELMGIPIDGPNLIIRFLVFSLTITNNYGKTPTFYLISYSDEI